MKDDYLLGAIMGVFLGKIIHITIDSVEIKLTITLILLFLFFIIIAIKVLEKRALKGKNQKKRR